MKILAFAATSSRKSINRQLLRYATRLLEDGLVADVTVELIDLNDHEMPIFSVDREEEDGVPRAAHDFLDRIRRADGLLISFAEHNGSYTAAFKNVFDWVSRVEKRVYQDKPTVMLATSPGPGGAARVLASAVAAAPTFGNDLRAHLSIPGFYGNFDMENGTLTDPDLDGRLRAALAGFGADPAEATA